MTKKRWTTEEERVLIDQIRRADSIKEALRRTSRLIDRTEAACMYHWYMVVSKRENPSMCFTAIGHNTKDVASNMSDNTENPSTSWWRRFLRFLKK